MDFQISGLAAFVTGAGGSIGAKVAETLAAEGACVTIADIDLAKAEMIAAGIVASGGRAVPSRIDVADSGSAATSIGEAVRHFGAI